MARPCFGSRAILPIVSILFLLDFASEVRAGARTPPGGVRGPEQVGTEFLDFEWFPGPDGRLGTPDDIPTPACPNNLCFNLSDEFASVGLMFDSGTLFQSDWFPGFPPTNHHISSTSLDVRLSGDGRGASIETYSVWNAVLWLLDSNEQVVAMATLVNPTPGYPFLGSLEVSSSVPYRRVLARPEGCPPSELSDPCDRILNIDNLTIRFAEIFADGFESGDTSRWQEF